MPKILIIHKSWSMDSFAATWALRRSLGPNNVEILGLEDEVTDASLKDRDVFIVGIVPPIDVLNHVATIARAVIVIAGCRGRDEVEELSTLPDPGNFTFERLASIAASSKRPAIFARFDANHSTAWLGWVYHQGTGAVPPVIQYIDEFEANLGRHRLKHLDQVIAGIKATPFDFEIWDSLKVDNALVTLGAERLTAAPEPRADEQTESQVEPPSPPAPVQEPAPPAPSPAVEEPPVPVEAPKEEIKVEEKLEPEPTLDPLARAAAQAAGPTE